MQVLSIQCVGHRSDFLLRCFLIPIMIVKYLIVIDLICAKKAYIIMHFICTTAQFQLAQSVSFVLYFVVFVFCVDESKFIRFYFIKKLKLINTSNFAMEKHSRYDGRDAFKKKEYSTLHFDFERNSTKVLSRILDKCSCHYGGFSSLLPLNGIFYFFNGQDFWNDYFLKFLNQ